jgi:signal transduction histidine kinase
VNELADALAMLPEMNPGPVFRLALDGTIELANRAARELYELDHLVGQSWFELCPRLDEEAWQRVLDGARNVQCHAALRGGTYLFILAHQPESAHVFVYGSDVTELERVRAELAERAQFPEMNPGPVCRLDTDARILRANRATRELLGLDTVRGECWFEVCPGMNQTFFDRVLESHGPVTFEARIAGRDFIFTHRRAPSGREVFVYGADVTEQKAAERAILQTEKMATLGTLAAGVAHELNNPAAAAQRAAEHMRADFTRLQELELEISGVKFTDDEREALSALHARARNEGASTCDLDGLERSDREDEIETWLDDHGVPEPWDRAPQLAEQNFLVEELDELAGGVRAELLPIVLDWLVHLCSVYRLLEEIRHGAGRVSEIVGALKSYSFLGQAPIQDIDVNEGLRQTLIIMRSKLKKGVHVVQELDADLPRIHAYGSELNQVWTNLIDNAVGAMDGQGKLVLRSRRDGDSIVVEIEDDGPGIPKDIVARIFDPFFTTKAPGQGTGLGLHTCHSIVTKKHSGTIDVSSQPGQTRFIVRIPIEHPQERNDERAERT